MKWNWQQKDWPNFTYKKELLEKLESEFLYNSGMLIGVYSHINDENKKNLIINIISNEALKTSEIEGEYLNRDSVQSSIKKNFGFETRNLKIPIAEQGVAEMMSDLYHNYSNILSHESICKWHEMLIYGRRDIKNLGAYRTHAEEMQVISGPFHNPKIHFEAPPSNNMKFEMENFINWFNKSSPQGQSPLSPLIRAGIAHFYFVCIHPFEDGNGRIARALAEKSLAQSLGQPTLIALSTIIQKNKKQYYDMLELSNKENEITNWLLYFANIIIEAQSHTISLIEFLIKKTKFLDNKKNELNLRQEKVIIRMFDEGIEGFKGGLSAENYIRITQTSRATATRDLQDLVSKYILKQEGERKSTRYYLNLS